MNNQLLSERPMGYVSANELWNCHTKEKYTVLKTTAKINDYYDFILSAGTVGYWLAHEGREPKDNKYYQIFNSVYNNTKHYELNRSRFTVYVVENLKSFMPTNGSGDTIWTDDLILLDDAIWLDKVDGESDVTLLCCKVHDEGDGTDSYIMLYELCKQIYNLYEEIFNQ